MAVKYHCKKCGKRFVDWGAEKLGFKCPDDGEELVRAGLADDKAAKRPALKRRAKKAVPSIPLEDEELLMEDAEAIETDEVEEEEEEESILLGEGPISAADDEVFPLEEEVVPGVDEEDAELEVGEESFDEAPLADEGVEEIEDWKE